MFPDRQCINTASAKLRALQAFFNELEENDEILKSPFRRLTKKRRNEALREQYDDPFFLRYEEVQQIMVADVPDSLKETKDAFLLQCALGCRIGDFMKLSMSGVRWHTYLPALCWRCLCESYGTVCYCRLSVVALGSLCLPPHHTD